MMYELNIIHIREMISKIIKCFFVFPKIASNAIKAIIGYTTIAIAGNGIPNIQAKGKANKLLHERVSFTSQKRADVSQAL